MLHYCLKCGKITESKDLKSAKTNKSKLMIYQDMQYVIIKN